MEKSCQHTVTPPYHAQRKPVQPSSEIVKKEYQLSLSTNSRDQYPEQLLRYLIFLTYEETTIAALRSSAAEIRAEFNEWHINQVRRALRQTFT